MWALVVQVDLIAQGKLAPILLLFRGSRSSRCSAAINPTELICFPVVAHDLGRENRQENAHLGMEILHPNLLRELLAPSRECREGFAVQLQNQRHEHLQT